MEGHETWKRGRRRKQLLDDLEEKRGHCELKKEALDRGELGLKEFMVECRMNQHTRF